MAQSNWNYDIRFIILKRPRSRPQPTALLWCPHYTSRDCNSDVYLVSSSVLFLFISDVFRLIKDNASNVSACKYCVCLKSLNRIKHNWNQLQIIYVHNNEKFISAYVRLRNLHKSSCNINRVVIRNLSNTLSESNNTYNAPIGRILF